MSTAMELVANALCLDFANTVNARPNATRDWLLSEDATKAWASMAGLALSSRRDSRADHGLTQLRSLREHIYKVFSAVADGKEPAANDVAAIADVFADALRVAEWTSEGDRIIAQWPVAEHVSGLAWPISASAMDLLTRGPLRRVGSCPRCGWLFLDTSRNGLRRWCSMATCGSRTKTARYFARSKEVGEP